VAIRFQTLLRLEVVHDYYLGGPCPDLEFRIDVNDPVLAAGKLLTRMQNGRLVVLCEVDESRQPLQRISGQTLWIGLHLNNYRFANFTQAPVGDGGLPLYANSGSPDSFDAALQVTQLEASQRIVPDSAIRPLTLSWHLVSKEATLMVDQRTLLAGMEDAVFATHNWPTGRYQLEATAAGTSKLSQWLRPPHWDCEPLWGAVAVTIADAFYADPPTLSIALAARTERLKYYIVADNFGQAEFDQLALNDAGASEQNRPSLSFQRIAADAFSAIDDIPPASLHRDPSRVTLFQSLAPVARRLGGYRKLQIQRASEIVVQHLPQAGTDQGQANFVVHLAKS
jgi:hypothetical protein